VKQVAFEAAFGEDWEAFDRLLAEGRRARRPWRLRFGRKRAETGADADSDLPRLYRKVCHHLALARDRQYSPALVDRLNELALRGHHELYGARGLSGNRIADFFLRQFPRRVRAEIGFVALAAIAFFGPLAAIAVAIQFAPGLAHYVLTPEQIAGYQQMYNPANPHPGMRPADSSVAMFAFYIWNNVKIGFQTFASGLAFGLGTLFYLVYNGMEIGAVAGYLTGIGYGGPFWSFTSGHGVPELTAIVISGAAGLRLGAALILPGRRARSAALREAARSAARLVYGAATLFTVAAVIEAFWSPLGLPPAWIKHAVGFTLLAAMLAYLGLAGRRRAA